MFNVFTISSTIVLQTSMDRDGSQYWPPTGVSVCISHKSQLINQMFEKYSSWYKTFIIELCKVLIVAESLQVKNKNLLNDILIKL